MKLPIIRTASPGPGKGCLSKIASGKSIIRATLRTSSLYNSRNGSIRPNLRFSGNPPTL